MVVMPAVDPTTKIVAVPDRTPEAATACDTAGVMSWASFCPLVVTSRRAVTTTAYKIRELPVQNPSLAAYVTLTALLVVTPGSSTAMVVRHVLGGGRAAGLAAAAGIAVANASWAAAAGLGVTAILSRVPVVFAVIRFGGAAYLAVLGMRALGRALLPSHETILARAADEPRGSDLDAAFRDGVVVNLLNPPIATFYIVVVPSFMTGPSPGRFALLAAIHVVLALLCHAAWAVGFDSLRTVWARPATRRGVDMAIGIALLALAVRMLR
jgi:threonine/homoserine/homoserine lactone efflux protein